MTRLNDVNQALQRQSSRAKWIPALATPSGALGECLRRADAPGHSSDSVTRTPRGSAEGRGLLARVVQPVVRTMRRNRTIRALKQLDARTLADIGVERDNIEAVAAKLAERKAPASRVRFAPFAALRKAWRRRAAIMQLQRLPNRMLYDIGIERGRIPAVVDHLLAESSAKAAAREAEAVRWVATPRAGRCRSEAAVETTHDKAA